MSYVTIKSYYYLCVVSGCFVLFLQSVILGIFASGSRKYCLYFPLFLCPAVTVLSTAVGLPAVAGVGQLSSPELYPSVELEVAIILASCTCTVSAVHVLYR